MGRRSAFLTVLVAFVAAAPAPAATVTLESARELRDSKYSAYEVTVHHLRFSAGPGEANRPEVRAEEGSLVVRDPAGLAPGPGCRQGAGATEVRCPAAGELLSARYALGDGDDLLLATPAISVVDAGTGDDVVRAPDGTVTGGAGDDDLVAEVLDGGPGADRLDGSPGSFDDRVVYADRSAPVHADGAGSPDDGEVGEGDRIGGHVERVVGGSGADDLVASGRLRTLDGRAGDDRLVAAGSPAQLYGGSGTDTLVGGPGDDDLVGDARGRAGAPPGADVLRGGAGDDRLSGGPGLDALEGGAGEDVLLGDEDGAVVDAVDADVDRVSCGVLARDERTPPPRAGRARADARDLVRGCAALARRGAARPQVLKLGTTDVAFGVLVGVGCSQDQPGGCRGAVTVRRGGRTVVDRRLSMRPGTGVLLSLVIPGRHLPRHRAPCRTFAVTVSTRDARGRPVSVTRRQLLNSVSLPCRDEWIDDPFGSGW